MAERRAKHPGFAVSIHPNRRVLIGLLAWSKTLSQWDAIGPNFLDFVQLIGVVLPSRRKAFHDRVLGFDRNDFEWPAHLMAI